jgi:hypothetical protein
MPTLEQVITLLRQLANESFSGVVEIEFRNGLIASATKAAKPRGAESFRPIGLETRQTR